VGHGHRERDRDRRQRPRGARAPTDRARGEARALADLQTACRASSRSSLEWRDLAKALGKGGLPDLEIDAAGPTISAPTNALLLACFGPRFSIELVTQVEKADGSGMKDEFTVRVIDNETAQAAGATSASSPAARRSSSRKR
jgi:exonuclease SbcC